MGSRILIFIFLLLVKTDAFGDEFVGANLKNRGTVSHIALNLTRDARNWKYARVINPQTAKPYATIPYTRLHVGTRVEFPAKMVRTRPYAAAEKSIEDICSELVAKNCVETLAKINSIQNPRLKLLGVLCIPNEFAKKEIAARTPALPETTPLEIDKQKSADSPSVPDYLILIWTVACFLSVAIAILLLFRLIREKRAPVIRDMRPLREKMEIAIRELVNHSGRQGKILVSPRVSLLGKYVTINVTSDNEIPSLSPQNRRTTYAWMLGIRRGSPFTPALEKSRDRKHGKIFAFKYAPGGEQ